MRAFLLIILLFSFAVEANDYIGIPIGSALDIEPAQTGIAAAGKVVVEGPFEGLFAVFDRYDAKLRGTPGMLVMATAEKAYSSFEKCATDTTEIWQKLRQQYGRPEQDENQAWWFDMGNRQRVAIDCTIYGNSGKIAMKMRVVDSQLHDEDLQQAGE